MTSTMDETLEYASKSLTWRRSWKTSGNKVFIVDHEQMIRQGAFDVKEDEDDQNTIDNSIEQRDDRREEHIGEENKNQQQHEQEHEIDGAVSENGRSWDTVTTSSFEEEPLSTPKKIKDKKKSKARPTKHAHIPPFDATRRKVSLAQSTKTKASSRRRKETIAPHRNRSIFFKVFKAYATPTRMAILTVAIILWLLNMRQQYALTPISFYCHDFSQTSTHHLEFFVVARG